MIVASAMVLAACNREAGSATNASVLATVEPAAPANAAEVATALVKAGLPVVNVVVLTEAGDTNQLLGRPGQYTSKAFFYDKRHPKAEGDEGENTIEVFDSAADAKTRRDYIARVTEGVAFATQYQLLRGKVLVRLDKALLPSESKQYDQALSSIVITE